MKKTSWAILSIIIALLGFVAYHNASKNLALSGEEEISALILDARSAVERKDYRRTMSYISADYSDSAGMSADALRAMIIRAYRDTKRYSVAIDKADILVTGDKARADLDVKVYTSFNHSNSMVLDGKMNLLLRKEPARRWLVFPTSKWRIYGVSGLPADISE